MPQPLKSPRPQIPAMILAGGRGQRLGTRDKALCQLGGRSFLAHTLLRLRTQCAPTAVNANGDLSRFSDVDVQVVPDIIQGYLGPLAGILTALDWAAQMGETSVITVAVDTPFFPHDLAQCLQAKRQPNKIALAATRDAHGALWHHPTFGLWPTYLRDQLRADILAGARKVTAWARSQGAEHVVFETDGFDPFFNINTPDDLQQAQAYLSTRA